MYDASATDYVRLADVVRGHAGILRQNYRSHASLLSIPNRLFYGDQLLAAADQQELRPPQWAPLRPVQPQQESSLTVEAEEQAEEEAKEGESEMQRTHAFKTGPWSERDGIVSMCMHVHTRCRDGHSSPQALAAPAGQISEHNS